MSTIGFAPPIPKLKEFSVSDPGTSAANPRYSLTIEHPPVTPPDSNPNIHKVIVRQYDFPNVFEAINFDVPSEKVTVTDSSNTPIPFDYQGMEGQFKVTFNPGITPGTTVKIAVTVLENPILNGVYQFAVQAIPQVEAPHRPQPFPFAIQSITLE